MLELNTDFVEDLAIIWGCNEFDIKNCEIKEDDNKQEDDIIDPINRITYIKY